MTAIELHPSPKRARWLRWFDFWTLRYGWDDRTLITEHGWLAHAARHRAACQDPVGTNRTGPAATAAPAGRRTRRHPQGAGERRGPPARCPGRARADPEPSWIGPGPPAPPIASADRSPRWSMIIAARPNCWRPSAPAGTGCWAPVGRARCSPSMMSGCCGSIGPARGAAARRAAQLRPLYQSWTGTEIGIEVPLIIEAGERQRADVLHRPALLRPQLLAWLAQADQTERRPALLSFLDAIERVQQLPSPVTGFARLVGREAPAAVRHARRSARNMLGGPAERSRDRLLRDLPDVAAVWDRLHDDLAARSRRAGAGAR